MIKLGSNVRDIYTGFEGIATSRTEWLYGCTRITIEPLELGKDGKLMEGEVFDEQRVETLAVEAPRVGGESSAKTGGPKDDPTYRREPVR